MNQEQIEARLKKQREYARRVRSTDKIVGVNYDRARNRWRASITVEGATWHLGYYLKKADCIESVRLRKKTDKAQSGTKRCTPWDFVKEGGSVSAAKWAKMAW